MPFTKAASSLGILPGTHVFVMAFTFKNLAHSRKKVNPSGREFVFLQKKRDANNPAGRIKCGFVVP